MEELFDVGIEDSDILEYDTNVDTIRMLGVNSST